MSGQGADSPSALTFESKPYKENYAAQTDSTKKSDVGEESLGHHTDFGRDSSVDDLRVRPKFRDIRKLEVATDDKETESAGCKDVSGGDFNPVSGVDQGDLGTVVSPPVVPVVEPLQPVAKKAKKQDLQPVAKAKKKVKLQPVAKVRKSRSSKDLPDSVKIEGYSWRPDGFTGWELWRRTPSVSKNNKPSSKHKWVAYYSASAMERLINESSKRK